MQSLAALFRREPPQFKDNSVVRIGTSPSCNFTILRPGKISSIKQCRNRRAQRIICKLAEAAGHILREFKTVADFMTVRATVFAPDFNYCGYNFIFIQELVPPVSSNMDCI